jgi:hypothetical protein
MTDQRIVFGEPSESMKEMICQMLEKTEPSYAPAQT